MTNGSGTILPTTAAAGGGGIIHVAKKLTLLPLIFLIYFEVAGGPYGEEPAVQAAGPFYAILGFLLFPFIWSAPEALITAELSTAFPGNGGFVIWADRAFGPFVGNLMGWWKLFCGVINVAAFPALCVSYLEKLFPILEGGYPRTIAVTGSTLVLSFLNYLGLTIVGYATVILGIVSLLPFIIMTVIAIPKIDTKRWLNRGQEGVKKDWTLFFNTLFWNLNFWDNVSTLAGEVDKPHKTFPTALFTAVVFTCLAYILPLMAVTGAISVDQSMWETGFMATAAEMIAGKWLKIWIEIGAALSAIGLYEAQLSSSAYQVVGMTEIGILPKCFGRRSSYFHTPWLAILMATAVCIGASFLDFTEIVASANFLYSLGMILELAAFYRLRMKYPKMNRPYRVPMNLVGLLIVFIAPVIFLVVIMVIADKVVYLISGIITVFAIGWYFFVKLCKSKNWIEFGVRDDQYDIDGSRIAGVSGKSPCKAPRSPRSPRTRANKRKRIVQESAPEPAPNAAPKAAFKAEQKDAVKSIGFGALLSLSLSKCPGEISRYLVRKFDCNKCSFTLENGEEVKIEEEDVHMVLGLPRGELDIVEYQNKEIDDKLKAFRTRWGNLSRYRILKNISDVDNIKKFNWVSNPELGGVTERRFPILSCWNDTTLKFRLDTKFDNGGFGRGSVLGRIPLPGMWEESNDEDNDF
ncbi:probable polyamine transporter At3g13620 [Impatiens glandulifera]|uniref:probable polyamine transporter At3g13620 n=1 Tax=Impatiens glandulifera TaxID=253017 RepID=UPI001FB0DECC|nr:probable polyamine transporter At3g13620 [Impatiens glandulifera]